MLIILNGNGHRRDEGGTEVGKIEGVRIDSSVRMHKQERSRVSCSSSTNIRPVRNKWKRSKESEMSVKIRFSGVFDVKC